MKVAFFGTYLFLVPLLQNKFEQVDIYIEDKCIDNPEVKKYLKIFESSSDKLRVYTLQATKRIHDIIPSYDFGFSASFGRIFKSDDISKFTRLINLHPGPVSLARGRHPLPCAIRFQHPFVGVTIHQIVDESIDSGPVLLEWKTALQNRSYKELDSLIKTMAESSFQVMLNLIDEACSDISFVPLDQQVSSYYPPLKDDILKSLVDS